MTVASIATTQRFNGNGSQTSFSFPYPYFANTDFKVYVNDVLQTLTTHYSVNPTGALSEGKYPGANIVFVTAPVAGSLNVKISRRVTAVQNTDISNITQLNMTDVETTLDKVVIIAQDSVDNANQVVDSAISEAVAAAEAAIADEVTAAANSATSAATSATNASNSASNAATSATNAANSATNASNSASNAATSATNAANSATAAQQIVDALDDLTAGAYLAYELRTANFTSVAGGRYFIDTSGLTLGTGITVSLFATPSVLTECVFTTNATDDRFIEFSNTPYHIEGYESNPLTVTKTCHIHLKFNPVNNKWIWINEYSSNERTRIVTSDLVTGTVNEVRPGDLLKVDTTSGVINIDAPIGTKYPRPGDTFTVEDYKGKFDQNNCIVDFNGKKLEGVVRNLVSMDLRGVSSTFEYLDDTTGWSRKSSMGGKR